MLKVILFALLLILELQTGKDKDIVIQIKLYLEVHRYSFELI